jgi:DNA-binding transcriptional ArsR family regulator
MQESTLTELENLFLALSDKTRLRLLALMADGEVPVGFLADRLGESQPKTSRHLAYLRNAGLVSARRDGKWIYYNIAQPADTAVARILGVTIESIAAVKVDGQFHYFTEVVAASDEFSGETDDTYAEAYESDYVPNEIEIFLL